MMDNQLEEGRYEDLKRMAKDRHEWRYGCQGPAVQQNTEEKHDVSTLLGEVLVKAEVAVV